MTWNTWWRASEDRDARDAVILQVVEEQAPDVLGIQECWVQGERTQADVMAEALGGHAAFVPMREGAPLGLGLVSRWPITRILRASLPSEGHADAALFTRVAHPDGPLRVVVGVTNWDSGRVAETTEQVAALQRMVREDSSSRALPSILLADLGYDRTQGPLAHLLLLDAWDAAAPHADSRTYSSTNRFASADRVEQYDRRIDHILYTPGYLGARAHDTWVVRDEPGGVPPSDHYPVVSEIGWSTSGA